MENSGKKLFCFKSMAKKWATKNQISRLESINSIVTDGTFNAISFISGADNEKKKQKQGHIMHTIPWLLPIGTQHQMKYFRYLNYVSNIQSKCLRD